MHRLPKIAFLCLSIAALGIGGCQTTPAVPDAIPPSAADSLAEANDPTAVHLHELAGRLLEFKALNQRLPDKLDDLGDIPGTTPRPAGLDPATGKAFVYLPQGPKFKSLPGRLIVYQSTSTGRAGSWCLLINDQNSDGRIVTYVQRVPDEILNPLP